MNEPHVIGKYRVIGTLGRGAMGVVYKAQDPEIGRVVAVKILRSFDANSQEQLAAALASFKDEARSAGNLRHPRIITVFEVALHENSPFIVMDFIEGSGLDQVLAREGGLPPGVAISILEQIAEGLDYAHERGVIHRDIKPSNILIDRDQNAFIVDFGVATFGQREVSGAVVGSPAYMSPEQILAKPITPQSDLFSFAIVAYEALTGFRPFDGQNFNAVVTQILNHDPRPLSSIRPEFPLDAEVVFERALAKDPLNRFETAVEFVRALADALGVASTSRSGRAERARSVQKKPTEWNTLAVDGSVKRSTPVSAPPPAILPPPGEGDGWQRPMGNAEHPSSHRGYVSPKSRPGVTFSQSDAMGTGMPVRRNSSRITRIIILLLGLLSFTVGSIILYLTVFSAPPSSERDARSDQGPLAIAAPVQDQSILLPADRYDVPELGRALDTLSDREILGVLVKGVYPIEDLLSAIRLSEERSVLGRLEALVSLLQNDSYVVRIEAIKALAQSADKRFSPAIMSALEDHDPLVRIAAANGLRELGDRRALSYLIARVKSEELPDVRGAIRRAADQLNGFPIE
jgi:serine/threonine protein kinase